MNSNILTQVERLEKLVRNVSTKQELEEVRQKLAELDKSTLAPLLHSLDKDTVQSRRQLADALHEGTVIGVRADNGRCYPMVVHGVIRSVNKVQAFSINADGDEKLLTVPLSRVKFHLDITSEVRDIQLALQQKFEEEGCETPASWQGFLDVLEVCTSMAVA